MVLVVCVCTAATSAQGATEKWRLGAQAYSFNRFTFQEAVEKTGSLNLKYIEAYPQQKVGGAVGDVVFSNMDAGQREWGNVAAMKKLLTDVGQGTELGTVVGNGAVSVGKRFNHARVPVVKGQAVPAWDPRPLKATGVTYATSAMGAKKELPMLVRIDTPVELDYYRNGGILQTVVRKLARA